MTDLESEDQPAADRAYHLAKRLVLTGELPGGHLFSEGDIAKRLGVSRTPVREAFLRLQAEDLLQLIPKRGAVVVPVPLSEAEDVLDAREAIEAAAVRRLLRRPNRVQAAVAELWAALDAQRTYLEAGDLAGFAEADEAFHRTIVEVGGNALTLRFYATLADRQRRMSMRALRPRPEHQLVIMAEHEALIRIISSRDEPAFAPALRAHLDRTHRR